MKCRACDCILSDIEAVRKDSHGEYLDLCYPCSAPNYEYIEHLPVTVERDEDEDQV